MRDMAALIGEDHGPERDYYTVPEAASLLHVSPATIWRWIDAGELQALRVGRRKIRIAREELERVVRPARAREVPAEEAPPALEPRSRRFKQKLLALAGVWKDVDTDRLIERIYDARHEAPPSPAQQA